MTKPDEEKIKKLNQEIKALNQQIFTIENKSFQDYYEAHNQYILNVENYIADQRKLAQLYEARMTKTSERFKAFSPDFQSSVISKFLAQEQAVLNLLKCSFFDESQQNLDKIDQYDKAAQKAIIQYNSYFKFIIDNKIPNGEFAKFNGIVKTYNLSHSNKIIVFKDKEIRLTGMKALQKTIDFANYTLNDEHAEDVKNAINTNKVDLAQNRLKQYLKKANFCYSIAHFAPTQDLSNMLVQYSKLNEELFDLLETNKNGYLSIVIPESKTAKNVLVCHQMIIKQTLIVSHRIARLKNHIDFQLAYLAKMDPTADKHEIKFFTQEFNRINHSDLKAIDQLWKEKLEKLKQKMSPTKSKSAYLQDQRKDLLAIGN